MIDEETGMYEDDLTQEEVNIILDERYDYIQDILDKKQKEKQNG